MGFALSRTIVYWGFDCAEDSIPFARSTSLIPFYISYLRIFRSLIPLKLVTKLETFPPISSVFLDVQ